jgi:hypothetical protein
MKRLSTTLIVGAIGCAVGLHTPVARAATETVLYSFCTQQNCTDGANPTDSLISVNGTLYGTTGNRGIGCFGFGCGTVFGSTQAPGPRRCFIPFAASRIVQTASARTPV